MTTRLPMVARPTTLTIEERRRFDQRVRDVEIRVLSNVETIVRNTASERLGELSSLVAFQRNAVTPKQGRRPKLVPPLMVSEVYRSFDDAEATLDALVRLSVTVTEYYDLTDDLFDRDVADGERDRAFLAHQSLVPVIVGSVQPLGAEATSYWTEQATLIFESFLTEAEEPTPDLETYLGVLDKQARLFGHQTGISALVGSDGDGPVARAEQIGECFFKLEQALLDGEQYAADPTETWNLWNFADRSEALSLIETWRRAGRDALAALPDDRTRNLEPLFAVDLAAWIDRREGL